MPDLESLSDEQLRGIVQQHAAQQAAPPQDFKIGDMESMSDAQLQTIVGQHREQRLAPYRQEAIENERKAQATEPWSKARLMEPGIEHSYFMRKAMSVGDVIPDMAYGKAQARFNRSEDTEDDRKLIAKRQLQEQLDAQRSQKEQFAGGVLAIPGQAAGILAGTKVAGAANAVMGIEAGGGLAGFAGRSATQAVFTPGMATSEVVRKNIEEGRDPMDIRGVAPGVAKSVVEAAVLQGAGKVWAKALPAKSLAGQYAVAGLTGPLSQQVTDLTTHALGLNSRYGRLQDIAEGKYGQAASSALLEMATFASMHALHGGEGKPVVEKYKSALDAMHETGVDLNRANQILQDAGVGLEPQLPKDAAKKVAEYGQTVAELTQLQGKNQQAAEKPTRDLNLGISAPPEAENAPAASGGPNAPTPPVAQPPAEVPAGAKSGDAWTRKERSQVAEFLKVGVGELDSTLEKLNPEFRAQLHAEVIGSREAPTGPKKIEPTTEFNGPEKAADAFRKVFDGATGKGGTLSARFGDTNVFLEHNHDTGAVRLDFTDVAGRPMLGAGREAGVSQELRPGSLSFLRKMRDFVGQMKEAGQDVEYTAKGPQRADLYKKVMERAGFTLAETKPDEAAPYYRWSAKGEENPQRGQNVQVGTQPADPFADLAKYGVLKAEPKPAEKTWEQLVPPPPAEPAPKPEGPRTQNEFADWLAGTKLSARDKDILTRRSNGETMQSIGDSHKITRAAVGKIEQQSLAKEGFPHATMSEWLKDTGKRDLETVPLSKGGQAVAKAEEPAESLEDIRKAIDRLHANPPADPADLDEHLRNLNELEDLHRQAKEAEDVTNAHAQRAGIEPTSVRRGLEQRVRREAEASEAPAAGPATPPGPNAPPAGQPEAGGAGAQPGANPTAQPGGRPAGGNVLTPDPELAARALARQREAERNALKPAWRVPQRRRQEVLLKDLPGVSPAALHAEADDVMQKHTDGLGDFNNMLRDARQSLSKMFGDQWKTLAAREATGRGESEDWIKGLDSVAQDMASQYRGLFPGFDPDHYTSHDAAERLLGYLKEGLRHPLTMKEAYEKAADQIADALERNAQADAARLGLPAQAVAHARAVGEAEGQAIPDAELEREIALERGEPPGANADFDPAEFGQPLSAEERQRGLVGGGEPGPAAAERRTPERLTALANEVTTKERQTNKLPEIAAAARRGNESVWDAALEKVKEDPQAPFRLVDDLEKTPRPASVDEDALLLQHRIALSNEHNRAIHDILAASPILNPRSTASKTDLEALDARERSLLEQIDRVDKVIVATGTEQGRALQFRRQLAAEDYSLSKMLLSATSAKGAPLTDAEKAQIIKLSDRIAELEKQLQSAESKVPRQGAGSAAFRDWLKQRAASETAKTQFSQQLADWRKANDPIMRRVESWWDKFRRFQILSGPRSLWKIGSAGLESVAINPLYEAAGAAWSRLPGFSKIAALAPREGKGFDPKIEAKSFMSAFADGFKDAWQTVAKGRSDLDVVYGGEKERQTFLDWPGVIHAALKAPAKRAEYTRSFLQRLDFYGRKGQDITAPGVLMKAGYEAYAESNRAIFREDNALASGVQKLIGVNPKDSAGMAGLRAAGRTMLPVVKVPTNVVAQAIENITGSITGSVRAGLAFRRGVETLTPQQADLIMRQLKRGSVGAAVFALGALAPGSFGGFYDRNDKKKKLDPMSIDTPAGEVPGSWLHHPLFYAAQAGATMRRTFDKSKGGAEAASENAVLNTIGGLVDETPMGREMAGLGRDMDAKDKGRSFGEFAKSLTIPQLSQWLAGEVDKKEPFSPSEKPARRYPSGIGQSLQTGIPWARQEVPARK